MKYSRHFLSPVVFFVASMLLLAQGNKSLPERLGYPIDAKLLIIHADDLERDNRNTE